MMSSDHDEPPPPPPPLPLPSSLRSGPIRTRNRVTFSLEEDPGRASAERTWTGGGQRFTDTELMERRCRLLALTSDLIDATRRPQQADDVSAVCPRGLELLWNRRGHTWTHTGPTRPARRGGVAEMSAVLGGLLELVEQHWTGPRSLHRNTSFLGRAYDLLSEQPTGGGASRDGGGVGLNATSPSGEVTLLRRKLERTEQQLEKMKRRLVATLKENYELKRRKDLSEAAEVERLNDRRPDDDAHTYELLIPEV